MTKIHISPEAVNMTSFYFEATLEFSRSEWNETKKGIVMAADEGEAWEKVMEEYEKSGGAPDVRVTIFPTIGVSHD